MTRPRPLAITMATTLATATLVSLMAAPPAAADATTSTTAYAAPGTSARSSFWVAEQEPAAGLGGAVQQDRIRVVGSDLVPGTGAARPVGSALRVELRPYESAPGAQDGDVTNTGGFLANRAEVYGRSPAKMSSTPAEQWPDPVGSTRWYSFSVLIPEDFALARTATWLDLVQWKGYRGGSPPVALEVHKDRLRLGGSRLTEDLGPVTPGAWTTFDVGISWATSPTEGWVEVWRDDRQVLARKAAATMDVVNGKPDPTYLKQGLYRSKAWAVTHVAWFGDTTVTTARRGSPGAATITAAPVAAVAPATAVPAAPSVLSTSTSVALSPARVAHGVPRYLTVKARAGAAPAGGTIRVYDGSVPLGTFAMPPHGSTVLGLSRGLAVGPHRLTVRLAAQPGRLASEAVTTLTVTRASTTATASFPAAVRAGRALVGSATVRSAVPGAVVAGQVRVYDGTRLLKTVVLPATRKGLLPLALPQLSVGTHRILVRFMGSSTAAASANSRIVTVRVLR